MATPQFALNEPLTDAQMAQVRAVAEGWVQSGLSTRRCDRARAEETSQVRKLSSRRWHAVCPGGVFPVGGLVA